MHLVEASPSLRKVQRAMLTGSSGHDNAEENVEYAERTDGIRIMWHDGIELVPGNTVAQLSKQSVSLTMVASKTASRS